MKDMKFMKGRGKGRVQGSSVPALVEQCQLVRKTGVAKSVLEICKCLQKKKLLEKGYAQNL